MSTGRKGLLLLLLYAVMILIAIPLHMQKGIKWNNLYYRQTEDTVFHANKNNRFSYTEADGIYDFDLTIDGYSVRASLQVQDENDYRIAFDDGFTVYLTGSNLGGVSIGGEYYAFSDTSLTVIDELGKTPLVFSPYTVEKTPVYDGETGLKQIGEWTVYKTAGGEHLYGYETWFDGSYPSAPPTFVTLSDGAVLSRDQQYSGNTLYVNEQNEMLTNPELLNAFPYQYKEDRINRQSHCWLLIKTAVQGRISARGHIVCFFLSLLYLLGAAQFLWPEELAFLGSRWQYRYEPELSDAGFAAARFSSVLIMGMGLFLLFLPLVYF